MMIFYHAAPEEVEQDCNGSGDCTRAAKLISNMPRGWADLMRLWYSTYTPIRISTDGTNAGYDKKYSKLTAEEKLSGWKLEEANVNPFHTLRSEEHTAELKSIMRITYDDFGLKKKKQITK